MKRLLAILMTLCLLLGCAAAETAAETPAEETTTHQIEMKTYPFYEASRTDIWRDDFPIYFVDGVEDLPFVELNDWRVLLRHIKGADKENPSGYDLTLRVDDTGSKVILTREDETNNMVFDFDAGTISFLDYIAFNLGAGLAYMDFVAFPEKDDKGQPFLMERTSSRFRYGDYTVLNLKDYGIPMIAQDGKYLLPMQTLAAFNLSNNGIGVYFNGEALFMDNIYNMKDPWTPFSQAISAPGFLPEELIDLVEDALEE